MIFKCPGAKGFRQPEPQNIKCAFCGSEIEIWSDETKASCPKCRKITYRDQKPGCIEWCKHAKECVGKEKYNKYMREKLRE